MHTKTAPNVQERIALFLIALQYKYTTGYQIKKYVRFCCKSYNYYTRKVGDKLWHINQIIVKIYLNKYKT